MRWWLPVLMVVAAAATLGPACTRPCDASTCTGCCDSSGDCVVGTRRTACGLGGAPCARCNTSDVCREGLCFAAAPDAGLADAGGGACACTSSCCLPDGQCAGGNLADACGPPRAFCAPCGAGERCEAGACVGEACDGCLDPLGVCQPGTTPRACGSVGEVCRSCAADETCLSGACVKLRCDSSNCRFGCCLADRTCVTTPSASACGLGGADCEVCDAGLSCLAGTCR